MGKPVPILITDILERTSCPCRAAPIFMLNITGKKLTSNRVCKQKLLFAVIDQHAIWYGIKDRFKLVDLSEYLLLDFPEIAPNLGNRDSIATRFFIVKRRCFYRKHEIVSLKMTRPSLLI